MFWKLEYTFKVKRLLNINAYHHLCKAETVLVNREKDKGTSVGSWFVDLMRLDPWYKDVVPNVRLSIIHDQQSQSH